MSDKRPLAEGTEPKEEPNTKKSKVDDAKKATSATEPENGTPDTTIPAPPKKILPPPTLPVVDLKLDPLEAKASTSKTLEKLSLPNLILFGLHSTVNKTNLETFLQQFGTVKTLEIKMAFSSKYALVEFEALDVAQATMETLQGRKLLGKLLVVKETPKPSPSLR